VAIEIEQLLDGDRDSGLTGRLHQQLGDRLPAVQQHGLPGASAADLLVGKQLLLQAIRTAAQEGAKRLIFCTTVAIERLAMRWGVDIQRLGPPVRSEGQLLVAAMIEFTDKTFDALVPATQTQQPAAQPVPYTISELLRAAA